MIKTLNISRDFLPQLSGEVDHYRDYLSSSGISSQYRDFSPKSLSCLQDKVDVEKVNRIVASLTNGGGMQPIIVSSDGYVIDGHHRYVACCGIGRAVRGLEIARSMPECIENLIAYECQKDPTVAKFKEHNALIRRLNSEFSEIFRTPVSEMKPNIRVDSHPGVARAEYTAPETPMPVQRKVWAHQYEPNSFGGNIFTKGNPMDGQRSYTITYERALRFQTPEGVSPEDRKALMSAFVDTYGEYEKVAEHIRLNRSTGASLDDILQDICLRIAMRNGFDVIEYDKYIHTP